ncbi:hypothetical protein FRB97_001744 [Tulasnella sp. 331]|nr:hypothetical protein FRB97_001744 [Tulasnella sp. 331]
MSLTQNIKQVVQGGFESAGKAALNVGLNAKQAQLNDFTRDHSKDRPIQTYFGVHVENTDTALKAGPRKMFMHERKSITSITNVFPNALFTPEAQKAGAHGYFKLHTPVPEVSHANILNDMSISTPVFVRFSTVGGSRGSADSVRDVRGFAVRLYTQQGNWDIVGNNNPVFFIQESIKFPDLIHAVKPEPNNEIPQAQSAHDNFWDFISLTPESMHHVMWHMSDRNIPRSFRMMEGFGVHSFICTNNKGERSFVKFHWKPKLGVHGLVWDEALKLAGQDPDFHRRDLYDAIEAGAYPEWELGIQVVPEANEHDFEFDLLDSTKIIPEELVPVKRIGTMVLNRQVNPTEFFTETEQIAFCTQHMVPGIDHSNDPLLHLRSFSYLDTQTSRLGSVNFSQLPINRPICPVFNTQRDGYMRSTIDKGPNYWPNRFGTPHPIPESHGGYLHAPAPLPGGVKERVRGPKFAEHYGQATMFYNSMSEVEKLHIIEALSFELGKVDEKSIQQKIVDHLNMIDNSLAAQVASAVDVSIPKPVTSNHGKRSEYLSMLGPHNVYTAVGRKVGIFVLDGFDHGLVASLKAAFLTEGIIAMIVGPRKGLVSSSPTRQGGSTLETQFTFETCRSTHFDGVIFVGGGEGSSTSIYVEQMRKNGRLLHAAREAYMHKKTVCATGSAVEWLVRFALPGEPSAMKVQEEMGDGVAASEGIVLAAHSISDAPSLTVKLNAEMAKHRAWGRDCLRPSDLAIDLIMLLRLPTETLLYVINQGFTPNDVLALSATSRVLYELCHSLPVWLDVARRISQTHPLPLPPFKLMDTLLLPELMAVCRRHSDLLENTSALPRVEPIKHKRLEISGLGLDGFGGVYHFAFLPGGRYLIILHRNGIFSCWDILEGSGLKVAEFVTGSMPVSWNFQMYLDKAEAMLVLVTERSGRYWVHVLRLSFSDEAVKPKLTELASVPAPFPCRRIHIQDDIVCGSGQLRGNTLLFLLDPIDQRQACIDTGIDEKSGYWDSFTHLPHGIMLYHEDQDHAYTYWYEDPRTLLEEATPSISFDQSTALLRHLRRPDGRQDYVFDEDCTLKGEREGWFVTHPWNTPTRSRDHAVSIMSVSRGIGLRPGSSRNERALAAGGGFRNHRTITQHWFQPVCGGTMPCYVDGELVEKQEAPRLRRWIHHIPFDAIAVGVDTSEIICPGSLGTHIVWLWYDLRANTETNERESATLRLSMASLLPKGQASEYGLPAEVVVRDIHAPGWDDQMLLGQVAAVDVEDAHGIVGLAMHPENDPAPDGSDLVYIHLLYL